MWIIIKRLYEWVISWGDKKGGTYALSTVSFIEASFFPIPPDPILLALCLGKPKKSIYFGLLCTFFSVLGAVAGYFIGWLLWEIIGDFFLTYIINQQTFDYVNIKYQENAFLAIIGAAFTPIPFKAFTVSAGVFKINIITLVVASTIGRGARFLTISALIYFFGPKIKVFIDKYFNLLVTLFFILLVGAFLLIKLL